MLVRKWPGFFVPLYHFTELRSPLLRLFHRKQHPYVLNGRGRQTVVEVDQLKSALAAKHVPQVAVAMSANHTVSVHRYVVQAFTYLPYHTLIGAYLVIIEPRAQ